MEVVYTGLHQTPEQIVEAAIQEDADAVGLSVLSGAHMTLFAKVAALLAERDAKDIVVFGGGIIPELPRSSRRGRPRPRSSSGFAPTSRPADLSALAVPTFLKVSRTGLSSLP